MDVKTIFGPTAVVLLFCTNAIAIEVKEAAPIKIVPPPQQPKIHTAAPIVIAPPAQQPKIHNPAPMNITPAPQPPRAADSPPPDSSMFGRDWRLYVPGAAYQTENVVAGTRTLHVSPGSGKLPHVLKISANGTYVWTAYGQTIRGAWVPGDKGYPVLLQNGYEGKNWKATMSNGQLLLWDGNSLAGQFRGR